MNQTYGTMTWDAKEKQWVSKLFVRTYTEAGRKNKLHAEGQFPNLRAGLDFFKQHELTFPLIYLEGASLKTASDWKSIWVKGKADYPFVDFADYKRNTEEGK